MNNGALGKTASKDDFLKLKVARRVGMRWFYYYWEETTENKCQIFFYQNSVSEPYLAH